jgi:uncharacterized protein
VTARPGRVRRVDRKWPDRPHWEHDAVLLGTDRHGTWLGAPAGTRMTRPGAGFVTAQAQVTLVPHQAPFLATFYEPGGAVPCEVYVDVTTTATWDDGRVTAVDLDLDVLRGWSGRVWVDDEDEFADHRVRYAYPPHVVRLALDSCERIHGDLEHRRPPYDGSAEGWLSRLTELP